MHKYTPVWISRWMVLGPRLWLLLALAVSLVAALNVPTEPGQSAIWVWPEERGWLWLRPSRVGRWVWRLGRVMWASRWSLICRVGLLAGLVGASGMAADCPGLGQVVWLPVVEWASASSAEPSWACWAGPGPGSGERSGTGMCARSSTRRIS